MMKRIVILIVGAVSFLISSVKVNAQQIDNLENTRWKFVVIDEHADYIEFKDSLNVTIYRCEIEDKIFGKYSIKQDTVIIKTISGEFDNEFPINSIHKHKKTEMYFLLQSDTLVLLENRDTKYLKQNHGQ